MKLKGIFRTDAVTFLSAEFSSPADDELIRAAVLAEHVRTAVYWSMQKSESGISSIKLSSLIRRNLRGILGEEFSFDTDIGKLADIGDIYRHEGHWLPMLERAIRIDEGLILILGGVPTRILSAKYELNISSFGHLRIAKVEKRLSNESPLIIQDFAGWLDASYGDLCNWAETYVKFVEHGMSPDIPPGEFSWYDGWGWRGLEKYCGDGNTPLLARRAHFWENEYCIIVIKRIDGEMRPTRCHRIDRDVGKRLRLAYAKRKKINITSALNFFYFDWWGTLPFPEGKIFYLASKSVKKEEGLTQYFFSKEVFPLVDRFLSQLGFLLTYNNEE